MISIRGFLTLLMCCLMTTDVWALKRLVIYTNEVTQVFSQGVFPLTPGRQDFVVHDLPLSIVPSSLQFGFPAGVTLNDYRLMIEHEKSLDNERPVQVSYSSNKAQLASIDLSYLTEKIGWNMIYRLNLDDQSDQLDLAAYIRISNHSGGGFSDFLTSVIVGDVNYTSGGPRVPLPYSRVAVDALQSSPLQSMAEYFQIDLPAPISIANGQELYIPWAEYKSIRVEKTYRFNFQPGFSMQKSNANILVHLDNQLASNLGVRLPAGDAFVYGKNQHGALLGKARFPSLTIGEGTDLLLGQVFDLYAEKINTKHVQAELPNTYVDQYEIRLHNAADIPRTVEIQDHYYGNWKLTQSTHETRLLDAQTLGFTFSLAPHQMTTIRYQIQTK